MHRKPDKIDRINIITLGCSKNTVDSEFLMRQLEGNDIEIVHNSNAFDAKTVIINTCGFIKDAKQESVNTILQFIRAKEKGLINHVYVFGCLSERYKNDLEKEIENVDKYFGANDLESIIEHLGMHYQRKLEGERYLTTPNHYAYLKISEGCDRRCSFCAIPMIRGRYRSKSLNELIDESYFLVSKGVKEIILIAQDLTNYGVDLYGRQALPEFLEKLSAVKELKWIRLHYAYPAHFPEEIIPIIKGKENICNYLDIPIQHASDKMLKIMQRGHNRSQMLALIHTLREQIPGIVLRTTVLTGHPGEGEKEFLELLDFTREMKFERLGVFTYSSEEGTSAYDKYKDTIPEKVKAERASEIMNQQMHISKELNNNKISKLFKVIIDDREGEHYVGRTEGDSPEVDNEVLIPVSTGELKTGNFYNVRITGAEEFDLYGLPVTLNSL